MENKGPHTRVTCSYVKSCDQRKKGRKEVMHTRCVSVSVGDGDGVGVGVSVCARVRVSVCVCVSVCGP
jgi:hypothetical protein